MFFWKKVKLTAAADRLVEEQLYAQALREFKSGVRRDGLWAKAFQNSQGDENQANALYIRYRVQSIKDEAEISAVQTEQYEEEQPGFLYFFLRFCLVAFIFFTFIAFIIGK